MPVTLTAETLARALARMDHDAAIDAQGALGWFGWDGEGSLHLRRYDLQLYLWYQLPNKYLARLEVKRAVAMALGRLLELSGVAYASLCVAPETGRLLELWEHEDPAAPRELRKLLEDSGLEPPDTQQLTWGSVMGLVEAEAREGVASALEDALEDGTLRPGTPGFRRRRDAITAAVLSQADRLDAIHAERLQHWRSREPIIDRIADMVASPPPPVEDETAAAALAPALWLLERAEDGLALTQTGALSRALVRDAVDRWPDWWDADLFGPPSREADIVPLHHLHGLLRRMRLLRRSGRRLFVTSRAQTLSPAELLDACATTLLAGETFDAVVAELTAALLLAGAPAETGPLAEQIHPVIVAEGWRAGDAPPNVHQVGATVGMVLARAEPLGIVVGRRWKERRLTDTGRIALHIGLRARALGPTLFV